MITISKFATIFGIFTIIVMSGFILYMGSLDNGNRYNIAFAQTSNPINSASNDGKNSRSIGTVIDDLNFTSAVGNIASLQNNISSGKPEWVVSGPWQLLVFKSTHEDNNIMKPATVIFDTTFDMAKLNGAELHQHTISITNFKLTNFSSLFNNNHILTTTFNGTATVDFLSHRMSAQNHVPTSIKIMDGSTISLWIDPAKVKYHFGNTPIYGIISKKSG